MPLQGRSESKGGAGSLGTQGGAGHLAGQGGASSSGCQGGNGRLGGQGSTGSSGSQGALEGALEERGWLMKELWADIYGTRYMHKSWLGPAETQEMKEDWTRPT